MKSKAYFLRNFPRTYTVIIFVLVYGGSYLLDLMIRSNGLYHPERFAFAGIRTAIICISAIAFGIWRIAAFYPYPGNQYGKWLTLTPWRHGMQMPKGSVQLNITDVFIISVLCLATRLDGDISVVVPAMIFFYVYIFVATASSLSGIPVTRYWTKRILILIIIPLSFYPVISMTHALISLGACYLLCYSHLRDVLKDYPWNQTAWLVNEEDFLAHKSVKYIETGYPYSALAVEKEKPFSIKKSTLGIIMLNALIIWWMHSILAAIFVVPNETDFSTFPVLIVILSVITVFVRLTFLYRIAPAISFWGRIFKGYFIIPTYDKVFVAPLTIIAVAFLSIRFMPESVQTAIWVMDGSVFLILCIAMGFPPTLSQWRNTGASRFTRNLTQEKQMQQIAKNKGTGLNKPIGEIFSGR